VDWNEVAFVVAGGRVEGLAAVDGMMVDEAFMWLHFTRKQHEEAKAAAKKGR